MFLDVKGTTSLNSATLDSTLNVAGITTLNGDVYLGNASVTGNITGTQNFNVADTATINNMVMTGNFIGGTVGSIGNLTVSNNLTVIKTTKLVGISAGSNGQTIAEREAGLLHILHDAHGSYTGFYMGINGTSGNTWMQAANDGTGSETLYDILMQPDGGNVGIGVTNPTYTLHVGGETYISGNVTITGNLTANNVSGGGGGGSSYTHPSTITLTELTVADANVTNDLFVVGNVTILGNLTADNFSGSGGSIYTHPENITLTNLSVSGLSNLSTTNVSALNSTGNIKVDGNLGVGVDPEHGFKLDVDGIINGTDNLYIDGNVGIGTTNPSYPLHINGSVMLLEGSSTSLLRCKLTSNNYNQRVLEYTQNGRVKIGTLDNVGGSANVYDKALFLQATSGSPIYFYSGNTQRMYLSPTGQLGIGTSSPNVTLDVNGDLNYSGSITNVSDRRIKKDITDIDDGDALNMIRQLQPKTYKYIDNEKLTNSTVYGYIAQEVASIIPNSVKIKSDFIPNILRTCICSTQIIDNTTTNFIVPEIFDNVSVGDRIKFKYNETYHQSTVSYITSNSTTILFKDNIDNDDLSNISDIFIYGKQVNDFHTMNKNAIFTVATAALQELDREHTNTKDELAAAKVEISTLTSRLTLLESIVSNLTSN